MVATSLLLWPVAGTGLVLPGRRGRAGRGLPGRGAPRCGAAPRAPRTSADPADAAVPLLEPLPLAAVRRGRARPAADPLSRTTPIRRSPGPVVGSAFRCCGRVGLQGAVVGSAFRCCGRVGLQVLWSGRSSGAVVGSAFRCCGSRWRPGVVVPFAFGGAGGGFALGGAGSGSAFGTAGVRVGLRNGWVRVGLRNGWVRVGLRNGWGPGPPSEGLWCAGYGDPVGGWHTSSGAWTSYSLSLLPVSCPRPPSTAPLRPPHPTRRTRLPPFDPASHQADTVVHFAERPPGSATESWIQAEKPGVSTTTIHESPTEPPPSPPLPPPPPPQPPPGSTSRQPSRRPGPRVGNRAAARVHESEPSRCPGPRVGNRAAARVLESTTEAAARVHESATEAAARVHERATEPPPWSTTWWPSRHFGSPLDERSTPDPQHRGQPPPDPSTSDGLGGECAARKVRPNGQGGCFGHRMAVHRGWSRGDTALFVRGLRRVCGRLRGVLPLTSSLSDVPIGRSVEGVPRLGGRR